ncbi:MAG: virulence factor [Acidimicrobiales bacterium]
MNTRRSRRSGNPEVTIICWRDIPAQVTAKVGGEKSTHLLHARFQHAIDRAAMVAGLTGTDSYVQQWTRITIPLVGDAQGAVSSEAERLEADFARDKLEAFVSNGGLDPAIHPDAYAGIDKPAESEPPE